MNESKSTIKRIICWYKESLAEWRALLQECGIKHKVTNESDYSTEKYVIEYSE